jgi:hypothetical protein
MKNNKWPSIRHFYNKNGELCKWINTNGQKTLVKIEQTGQKKLVPSSLVIKYLKRNPKYLEQLKRWDTPIKKTTKYY